MWILCMSSGHYVRLHFLIWRFLGYIIHSIYFQRQYLPSLNHHRARQPSPTPSATIRPINRLKLHHLCHGSGEKCSDEMEHLPPFPTLWLKSEKPFEKKWWKFRQGMRLIYMMFVGVHTTRLVLYKLKWKESLQLWIRFLLISKVSSKNLTRILTRRYLEPWSSWGCCRKMPLCINRTWLIWILQTTFTVTGRRMLFSLSIRTRAKLRREQRSAPVTLFRAQAIIVISDRVYI